MHLDGHHKLIRWKLVIHGGIDGYSRLITFLRVSGNNRAETVLSAFLKAVDEFGQPSRVRTDKGGENVLVAHYLQRGMNRGNIITGRSTHNQRIERFWRDLLYQLLLLFLLLSKTLGFLIQMMTLICMLYITLSYQSSRNNLMSSGKHGLVIH